MAKYNLRAKGSVDYLALSGQDRQEMATLSESGSEHADIASVGGQSEEEGLEHPTSGDEQGTGNMSVQLQQQLDDDSLDVDQLLEDARIKHQLFEERQAKLRKLQELAQLNEKLEKGEKREKSLFQARNRLSSSSFRASKGADGVIPPVPKACKKAAYNLHAKSRSKHGDHALPGETSTAGDMAKLIASQCKSLGLTTDSSEFSESSSDSGASSHRRRRNGQKSGIHETNKMYVKKRQKFPQAALRPEFLARKSSPTFEELQLPLFVAGEMEIILHKLEAILQKGRAGKEVIARLHMLRKTAYRADYLDWPVLRSTHEAILRNIENGFAGWDSNFEAVEKQVLERSTSYKFSPTTGGNKNAEDKARTKKERKWYCGAFNKGECEFTGAKHRQELLGKERTVHHICSSCMTEDSREASHSALAEECPHRASQE